MLSDLIKVAVVLVGLQAQQMRRSGQMIDSCWPPSALRVSEAPYLVVVLLGSFDLVHTGDAGRMDDARQTESVFERRKRCREPDGSLFVNV